jgi:hypothetical protein
MTMSGNNVVYFDKLARTEVSQEFVLKLLFIPFSFINQISLFLPPPPIYSNVPTQIECTIIVHRSANIKYRFKTFGNV